jgi:hypothetical protein
MNSKRAIVALAIVALLMVGVAAVSADPQRPWPGQHDVRAAAVQAALAETGMTRLELAAALQDGGTLAEVVTAAGGDVQAVIDAAVAAGQARIDTALANGRITEAQAASLSADLTAAVTAALNGEDGPQWVGVGRVRLGAMRLLIDGVAEATGLTPREIRREWRDGQSLTAIVEANGGDAQAVLNAAVNAATERIDAAVADGAMAQSQADLLLPQLTERLSEAMNAVHTPRRVRGAV